ncbi:troponin t [Plakobranchus ocellatus]|uniref:Troponin t n=1 Tax=Plakobranchus ocellatus TaxID=259542 RepID=A0AAV4BG71_9GAST|nr:troponin t [Plakobranchus ocellatus]
MNDRILITPKIQLCSKYERHTDLRSYKDRISHFETLAKDAVPDVLRLAKAPDMDSGSGTEGYYGEPDAEAEAEVAADE